MFLRDPPLAGSKFVGKTIDGFCVSKTSPLAPWFCWSPLLLGRSFEVISFDGFRVSRETPQRSWCCCHSRSLTQNSRGRFLWELCLKENRTESTSLLKLPVARSKFLMDDFHVLRASSAISRARWFCWSSHPVNNFSQQSPGSKGRHERSMPFLGCSWTQIQVL